MSEEALTRAQIVREVIAHFGGQRAASEALAIPQGTLSCAAARDRRVTDALLLQLADVCPPELPFATALQTWAARHRAWERALVAVEQERPVFCP